MDKGIHTPWWTLRQQLSTHQVVIVVLPTTNGQTLKIRKSTTPEPMHRETLIFDGITSMALAPFPGGGESLRGTLGELWCPARAWHQIILVDFVAMLNYHPGVLFLIVGTQMGRLDA